MITNEHIVKKVVGLGNVVVPVFDSPFNVYGDKAVSRSIVQGSGRPMPHLDIKTGIDVIERFANIFDLVWKESIEFRQEVVRAMTGEQKRDIGSGKMFDVWSGLDPALATTSNPSGSQAGAVAPATGRRGGYRPSGNRGR